MFWFRHIKRQLAWLVGYRVGNIVVSVPAEPTRRAENRVLRVTEWMSARGYDVAESAPFEGAIHLTFHPQRDPHWHARQDDTADRVGSPGAPPIKA